MSCCHGEIPKQKPLLSLSLTNQKKKLGKGPLYVNKGMEENEKCKSDSWLTYHTAARYPIFWISLYISTNNLPPVNRCLETDCQLAYLNLQLELLNFLPSGTWSWKLIYLFISLLFKPLWNSLLCFTAGHKSPDNSDSNKIIFHSLYYVGFLITARAS